MPGFQISRKPVCRILVLRSIVAIIIAFAVTNATALAEEITPSAAASRVESKLDELESWISKGDKESQKLRRWQEYLLLDDLREELEETEPDPAVVMRSLRKFRSEADGLRLRRFVALRHALADWSRELKTPRSGKLADYAAAARGDHSPITEAQLAEARGRLRQSARQLEQSLGTGSTFAGTWKEYLQWDLLEPQLADDHKLTRKSLNDLMKVLVRFRKNEPGLELEVFRDVADDLERFIPTVTWATTAKVRDASAAFDGLLKGLEQQLQRHNERPTSETHWKITDVYRLAKQLGDSPSLVSAIKSQLSKPNVMARVSLNFLNRTAQRPVTNRQPVVDCILGTSIRGTACTQGTVTFRTEPADNHIVMQAVFTGQSASQTVGYNKPVKIYSSGITTFTSTKQLQFSDDAFYVNSASASARTKTRTNAIRKTGGKFGKRIVEKIAWKRVGESKRQAESISARHAEVKVATGFDEEVNAAMVNGRKQYLERVVTPLTRRDLVPEYFRWSSTSHDLGVAATIARSTQIAASVPPTPLRLGHDLSFQLHESAINNYLPLVLSGVTLSQDEADQPQQVSGDAPQWLKRVQESRRKVKEVVEVAAEPILGDPSGEEDSEEEDRFQPWSITLNNDFPASVSFKQGNVAIRMRASQLTSEEREFKNWDFVVTYKLIQNGNGILLRRVGKIEVLPTGFDPEWDKKMSTAKSGFRSTLSENLNARAERGEGFPREIPIPPLVIPDLGELTLRQLDSDSGWLTVGWGLP